MWGESVGRIVCFGEVLLRLATPGAQAFLQSPSLDLFVGGAEANVAVSLARFGHDAAMVTTLPDSTIGRAVTDQLRHHGVDVSHIRVGPGRMGLYFVVTGNALRASEVVYDRALSAFALTAPGDVAWPDVLKGRDWLHLSGITPALGENGAAAAQRAAEAATRAGVAVSFDGNFRAKLWAASGGDASAILKRIMDHATLACIDHRDIGIILGDRPANADGIEARRAAAAIAFQAFPKLQRIACTMRVQSAAQNHRLSAVMFTRSHEYVARTYDLEGVVDRIGGGDAFAAGILHGLMSQQDDREALNFGLAAACLKHSYPGDFNLARVRNVLDVLSENGSDIRR